MSRRAREPQPGLEARRTSDCARCPEDIAPGDRYVFQRGRPIHVRCASGADDEGGGDE